MPNQAPVRSSVGKSKVISALAGSKNRRMVSFSEGSVVVTTRLCKVPCSSSSAP